MKTHINSATYNECKKIFFDSIKNCNTNIVISGNIKQDDAITYSNLIYGYLNIHNIVNININNSRLKNIIYPFNPNCKNLNKDNSWSGPPLEESNPAINSKFI